MHKTALPISLLAALLLNNCETQPSKYQSVYGRVTSVKNGEEFKIKGLKPTINLMGITAPDPSTDRGKRATALLHYYTREGEVECLVMKGGGKNKISGYCRFDGQWFLNHQMLNSNLVDPSCEEWNLNFETQCTDDALRYAFRKNHKFD